MVSKNTKKCYIFWGSTSISRFLFFIYEFTKLEILISLLSEMLCSVE